MQITASFFMKSASESNFFSTNKTLNLRGRLVNLSVPAVMGIMNATPDSFYDGGHYSSQTLLLKRVEQMIREGATFIDVGGYSTRPGADEISEQEEINRIVPVVKG